MVSLILQTECPGVTVDECVTCRGGGQANRIQHMEAIADMMDRVLTPENGGNVEAGEAVIRKLAARSRAHFEQMNRQAEE